MTPWREWLFQERLRSYLDRLARSSKPIVIGPWRSEVGFEVLYWLPWLAWLRERYKIEPERLFVIARGGSGVWYDALHVVDLYDYVLVGQVRKAMLADAQAHGSIKQQRVTTWERKLVALMAHDLGVRRYHWLHPSWCYRALTPWWEGRMGHQTVLSRLRFGVLSVPHPPLTLALPEKFVAVRFYARHTWPMTEDLRAWTATLVDRLASRIPVVLLDTTSEADEHQDFPLSGPNIVSLAPHVTLANNLAVQSAVLAKAQGFIGPYGGTLQLAVRLHKPAVGFFSTFEGTAYAHKHLTEWLGVQQRTSVLIGRPDDAQFIHEAVG